MAVQDQNEAGDSALEKGFPQKTSRIHNKARTMSSTVVRGGGLTEEDADLEVAAVLSKGLRSDPHSTVSPTKRYSNATPAKHNYSPFRLSTVMTNVSRGNTRTCTPSVHNMTVQQMAAQGELLLLKAELQDSFMNLTDEHGLTLLAWAAANDQFLTVEYLLSKGADVSLHGDGGLTPMILSASNGHDRVLKLLLEGGADVNQTCQKGNTALLYAAYNKQVDCVSLLLQWGADLTAKSDQGKSAYDIAISKGHKDVQQVIERHMLKLLDT